MTSLLLAFAAGCAPGPLGAPDGSIVTVPEDEGLVFDAAYQSPTDGIGLLVKTHANVFGPDERPLNGVQVEITSGWSGTYVVAEGAVTLVDTYEEACEGDSSDECNAWYDGETERYVEFAGEYEDLGGLKPNYLSTVTDNRGVADFYVFIDSIPYDDQGEVIAIPMYADIRVDTFSWEYDFSGG